MTQLHAAYTFNLKKGLPKVLICYRGILDNRSMELKRESCGDILFFIRMINQYYKDVLRSFIMLLVE